MSKKIFYLGSILSAVVLLGAGCIQFGSSTARGPAGMFRSGDKGETWTPIVSLPTATGVKSLAGVNVYKIYTDPGDVNAFYLTSRGQGVFYTYNNGNSWNSIPVFGGSYIYGLTVDPSNKCVIYVADAIHIYKTVDCSRTWQLVYTEERPGEHVVALAIDYGNPKVVYGAEQGGDILLSDNSGDSWRVVKRFGFTLQNMISDPNAANRLYVASYENGLFRSDDRGANWIDLSAGLRSYSGGLNFYRLLLHPGKPNNLFWISQYGILRSSDAGATWTDLKLITPPGSVNIYAFGVNPKNDNEMYYVGTILGEKNTHVRSTFYKTVDGGKNWVTKKLPSIEIPVSLNVHTVDPSVLIMGFTAGGE